mgnify:CR=1 FL=1
MSSSITINIYLVQSQQQIIYLQETSITFGTTTVTPSVALLSSYVSSGTFNQYGVSFWVQKISAAGGSTERRYLKLTLDDT